MPSLVEGLVSESDEQSPVLGKKAQAPAAKTSTAIVRSAGVILVTVLAVCCFFRANLSLPGSLAAADVTNLQGLQAQFGHHAIYAQGVQPGQPGQSLDNQRPGQSVDNQGVRPPVGVQEWSDALGNFTRLPPSLFQPLLSMKNNVEDYIQLAERAFERLDDNYMTTPAEYIGNIARVSSILDNLDRRSVGFCKNVLDMLEASDDMLNTKVTQMVIGEPMDIGVDVEDEKTIMLDLVSDSIELLKHIQEQLTDVTDKLEAAGREVAYIFLQLNTDLDAAKNAAEKQNAIGTHAPRGHGWQAHSNAKEFLQNDPSDEKGIADRGQTGDDDAAPSVEGVESYAPSDESVEFGQTRAVAPVAEGAGNHPSLDDDLQKRREGAHAWAKSKEDLEKLQEEAARLKQKAEMLLNNMTHINKAMTEPFSMNPRDHAFWKNDIVQKNKDTVKTMQYWVPYLKDTAKVPTRH